MPQAPSLRQTDGSRFDGSLAERMKQPGLSRGYRAAESGRDSMTRHNSPDCVTLRPGYACYSDNS